MDQAKENNQLYSSDELFQAQPHLNRHILSYMNSVSIKCAVHLGIFDAINGHGKPITHSDLVSSLHIKPAKSGSLRRLIRLLVHSGFITTTKPVQEEEEEEYYYDLTLPSRLLLNDETMPCLSPCVMTFTHRAFVSALHLLGDWFRHADDATTTPFAMANNGKEIWECWGEDGEFGGLFDKAMAGDSAMMRFVVKDLGPFFEGVSSLVDVGGGTGTMARILAGAFPEMKCTVLDLPHVVANFPESSSDENLKFVAGDMFQDIPAADAILFKIDKTTKKRCRCQPGQSKATSLSAPQQKRNEITQRQIGSTDIHSRAYRLAQRKVSGRLTLRMIQESGRLPPEQLTESASSEASHRVDT